MRSPASPPGQQTAHLHGGRPCAGVAVARSCSCSACGRSVVLAADPTCGTARHGTARRQVLLGCGGSAGAWPGMDTTTHVASKAKPCPRRHRAQCGRGGWDEQEHVHLRVPQLGPVKPVLNALLGRCPSLCCFGEFYTSKPGFVMMPEHRREMSEITRGMARTGPTPQRKSELSRIKNCFRRRCQWSPWLHFCYF